jgi:AhpD family alkylhydroperoxidase
MARLPYPTEQALAASQTVVDRIVRERGSLMNLYRMLLHAPPIAEGWRALLTAIRQQSTLPGRIRELVILWIGVRNGAGYEVQAHTRIGLAEGLARAQIDALAAWRASPLFDERERAALAYAESMTDDVHVPQAVFDDVRARFDERQVVELSVTVAAYNMVSRFLESVGVDPDT